MKFKFLQNPMFWFFFMVVAAFAGAICFFSVDGYNADRYGWNTGLIVAGAGFAVLAVFGAVMTRKKSTGGKPDKAD